ncbi:GFA family protein [Pseudoroseicyclus sp. CXY001]|uniref:GFA family protein n=1 Tax=Pseudoroseicyclus sp. CXY001 TaxID=3242492 RepID=UPI0035709FCE
MRRAACQCGQLSIELEGAELGGGICHCLACQRRTGSVFAALASFGPPWRVTGQATEYLRVGDRQGSRITFRFCPVCGTNLFHTEEGGDWVTGAVGAFADPDLPPPRASIYESRRHGWVTVPEGTRRFDLDPE